MDASKIIKRDSYSAMADALTILETAREQARVVLEGARRQGEEEGRAVYVRGLAQALDALDQFYARAEPEIVSLAMAVARKIIGAELATSPDTVLLIVREALTSGRRARRIEIKVNPSDAPRVRAGNLNLASSCEVEITATAGIEPGGCIIETEFGIIDARLETQLRVIEQSLGGAGLPACPCSCGPQ